MSDRKTGLLSKIEGRTATVDIIGLSYVSLPLAMEITKAGYKTISFDVQEQRVEQVNRTHNYIGNVADSVLEDMVKSSRLSTTSDFSFISSIDCVVICAPTPLDKYQQSDINYVRGSTEFVAKYLHADMLVILGPTTCLSTIEELLKPILEESGLVCGEGFFLAFSPKHVDPGSKQCKARNTPKVVDGVGKDNTEVATALYHNVLGGSVYKVASPAMAEMEKLLENTYCNINIGLANEMAIICNRVSINVRDVIGAAKAKPYGFQAFYLGPGLGGRCIPLGPFYLTQKAREYDYHTQLIEISGRVNTAMPKYMIDRVMKVLNRSKTTMNGARVLILGVTYRSDTDGYCEFPALNMTNHLLEQGADAVFSDPYIPEYKHKGSVHKSLTALTDDELKNVNIVIICTAHGCFDYNRIQSFSKAIFDTRNAMKNVADRSNVELL